MAERRHVKLKVNGIPYEGDVEPRMLLVDFIREDLELIGTHSGCEHGVCGSCTILYNGSTARSCLIFAIQADGAEIMTIEGLAEGSTLHPIQKSFREYHGLQCGYCTPGMLMTAYELIRENPDPTQKEVRKAISGVLCRCTGYKQVVDSVMAAASEMRGTE